MDTEFDYYSGLFLIFYLCLSVCICGFSARFVKSAKLLLECYLQRAQRLFYYFVFLRVSVSLWLDLFLPRGRRVGGGQGNLIR